MIQIYFKCLNDRSKIGRQDVGAIPTASTNTPWTSQIQIISVTEPYIKCSNDHPVVYYDLKDEPVQCGYCNIKYVYIGGEIGSTDTIKATGETGTQATLIARKQ